MQNSKELIDFLSTIDSLQDRFRESVISQQREINPKHKPVDDTLELIAESTRYVDSQRGTF